METTPPAAAPPRNAKEARSALERLRAEGDRFSVKLRALEAHAGYRRLRGMASTGTTLQAWEHARAATDELSEQLRAYRAMVERATTLLGPRARIGRDELAEVTRILHGPVDGSAPAAGPAPQRGLSTVLTRMTAAHDEVLRTVNDVEEFSGVLQQRLGRLGEALRASRARVGSLTFPDDAAAALIDGLESELAEIAPLVLADPLGGGGSAAGESSDSAQGRLRRLGTAVDNAQTYLATLTGQQAELRQSISRLRERVAEVEAVEQECRRTETEVRARISEPVLDPLEYAGPVLRPLLGALDRLQLDSQWPRLRDVVRELDERSTLAIDRAEERRAAARALIEQRDELRGRLESYRAMAIWYGHAEDLDLADEYERAYQMLWSAPCDLSQAGAGVVRYQQAVIERTEGRASDQSGEPSG